MADSGSSGGAGSADAVEPDVRFSLANERTLLAYQRTAIALMAAAIGVGRFFGSSALVLTLAAGLLAAAAVAAVGGYRHFMQVDRSIRTGRPMTAGPAAHVLSIALLGCLVLAAVYLVDRMIG